MKNIFIKSLCVSAIFSLVSCNNDDTAPDTPQPTYGKYEQLTFSSADEPSTRAVWSDEKGSGNLIFNWEGDNVGTEMVALLAGGEQFIPNYPSANPSADEMNDIKYHSYMTITPNEDLHKADFTTLRYYDTEEKSSAKAVFAMTPVNDLCTFEADETNFKAQMEMPASFEQTASRQPEFLSDYMMMCGQAKFENGSASIPFRHIPATFRFIITNKRPSEANLRSVSLTIDGTAPVGSKYAEINGRYDTESLAVDFPDDSDNPTTITTLVSTTLQSQQSYTAYALALPLPESESFEGKELKFVITTDEHDFLSFVLKGGQIAGVNPGGEYNWVGGKSYTIRMSLDDVLTFEGISVTDWADSGTIDGGEAEETYDENGFMVSDGSYEPATLNADDVYEISNLGNLLWYAANKGSNSALLTSDIKIGSEEAPYVNWNAISFETAGLVFDGGDHTIDMHLTYDNVGGESKSQNVSLFNANNTTIRNLVLRGSIHCNSSYRVGAVSSGGYAVNFENITSYVGIVNEGTAPTGGITGYFGVDGERAVMSNCAVYADVSGRGMVGGLVGQGWAGWQYYTIKNSAFYGSVSGAEGKTGAVVGYSSTTGGAYRISITDTYYYSPTDVPSIGGWDTAPGTNNAAPKTAAEFASKDMATLLNADQETEVWEYLEGNLYPTLK